MARRRHFWGRTPLPHDGGPKLWRMVLFLFVLAMMYTQMRQASNWAWLARSAQAQEGSATPALPASTEKPAGEGAATAAKPGTEASPAAPSWETIRQGPTDKEEWEERRIKDSLTVVTDKTPLQDVDMPAYWSLMRWVLAQSSQELAARAVPKVTMNDLWHDPLKHRGQIVRVPLYIRMIKKFETTAENSAGLKTGYELWGWSDSSKAHPFFVVVPEIPPGMREGEELDEEGVFVGYFLKWMLYHPGVGKPRSAPVLIGRVTGQPKVARTVPSLRDDPLIGWAIGGVAIVVFGILTWVRLSPRRIKPIVTIPKDEEAALSFLEGAFDSKEKPAAGLPGLPAPDDESRKPQETATGGG